MKKFFKFLFLTVTLVVVLAIAAVVAATVLIDPNDYKDNIVKVVKTETGRDLAMQGDIKLSFFPWLGLELGKTQLSNAPGFGKQPMASIDRVEVKLKLMPLLRQEVEIDTVVLDGLALNLAKNAKGASNWDDIVARTTKPAAEPAGKTPETAKTPAASPVTALTVGGIDVRRAQLHWVDASDGTDAHVRNLRLKTGKLAAGVPITVRLGFDLETGKPVIHTPFDMVGKITVDPDKQTLDVSQLQLSLLDLDMSADIKGSNIIDAPRFKGRFALQPANLRQVLKQLGITVDMHASALQSVSLNTDFGFDQATGMAALNKLVFKLDDSTLNGKATYKMSKVAAIRADIAVDQIDADRYLPQATDAAAAEETKAAPLVIPVAPLRTLDLVANFRLNSLKLTGIRTEKINIPIKAKDGFIKIGPSRAEMYGGKYLGTQTLDVRKGAPTLTSSEKLTNVQIGDFLKDADVFDKFTGVGNVSADISARGMQVDDFLNTLNGKASASLKNGRIKGLNLHKLVNNAKDAYNKAKGKPVESRPEPTDEMEYAQLTATASIANGIVSNKDLKMDGPYTKVTGQGTVNLPKLSMDYRLGVLVSENKKDPPVPVRIHGPFDKLKYDIDLAKIVKDKAQKEVQKKVEAQKKETKKKLEQDVRKKLKDVFKR